jgi:hypothetical protein
MTIRYGVCFFLVLGIPTAVNAQTNRGHQAHPGGTGANHAGQAGHPQQHMMNQQMQHEYMMQQFWHEQMMFAEMMSPRRPYGGRTHAHSNNLQSQSAAKQSQQAAMQSQSGDNKHPMSGHQNQAHGKKDHPSGTTQPAPNHESGKGSKQDLANGKAPNHKGGLSALKHETKNATHANVKARTADRFDIALLHDAHKKLKEADHDYQGHRVKAMNHIASALEHLGSPRIDSDFGYSWGNLPQAQSDQILRDALVHLNQTENSLRTGNNRAAHHDRARTSVAEAIHELHTALAVR